MKVSVITVCLNAERYIGQALGSVLAQDYHDLECIVVDGGSTDGTLRIIQALAAKDDRIAYQTGPDLGIADAMNLGVERATGEIIGHLHADDFYVSSSVISTVVGEMLRCRADWCTGGVLEIDASGQPIREISARTFSYTRLLRNNIILHPATFVRRPVFEVVGRFDANLNYAMDYDLWLRMANRGEPAVIGQTLAGFRVHQGSLSSKNRLDALDEEYDVRKRYLHGGVSSWFHALYQGYRRGRGKYGI